MPFGIVLMFLALLTGLTTTLSAQVAGEPKGVFHDSAGETENFTRQPKIAVLVGIANYQDYTGFSRLRYPLRDVDGLEAELIKQGYAVRHILDAEASRGVVRKTLRELSGAVTKEQSTFVFYFSGHGFEQRGQNYLALYGTVADDLEGEGLSVGELFQLLDKIPARRKMVFLDACRNDPLVGRQTTEARSFSAFERAEGLRVLYSTSRGGVSYENEDLHQGVFTHFLIRGLQGEAARADGMVTFDDLATYTAAKVSDFGVSKGQIQVPFESGEHSPGEFFLAKSLSTLSASPAITRPATPPATPDALSKAEKSAKEGLEDVAAGKYREAVDAFSRATEIRPPVAEERFYRGVAYGHLGEFQKAAEDFSSALELGGEVAEVYGNRGFAYLSLGQNDRALQDFTRAIELKPDYAAAWSARGRAREAQRDHREAISDFDKAIELEPNAPTPQRARGVAEAALANYPEALRSLGRAIQLDPDDPESWTARGDVYSTMGQTRDAESDYTQAVRRVPTFTPARVARASLYMQTGRFDLALTDYNAVIERQPALPEVWADRGAAHAALKQYEEAVADCSRALQLNPELAQALNTRGFAFAGMKRFDKAVADYDLAIKLKPDYSEAYTNRAVARKALGDSRGSRADTDKAEEIKRLTKPRPTSIV